MHSDRKVGVFPPFEMAKNAVAAVPGMRRLSQRRHSTGVVVDALEGDRVLEELSAELPRAVRGCDLLELGPGTSLALCDAATRQGARVAAFDVVQYVSDGAARELGVDYRVRADGVLPWPDEYFDVVWSHSVLEHVRDPHALLCDTYRVLRPGGHHVALIDMETHFGGRGEPDRMFEFLRFSERSWELMTSHRSSWLNRLRLSDWRVLYLGAGFVELVEAPVAARCGVAALRAVPYLAGYSDEDLVTKRVVITARRPPRAV